MLEVLRHQQLDGVLATVVRYYGGIKLGAGGLVRAYTDAVAQALQQAEKVAPVALVQVHCELPRCWRRYRTPSALPGRWRTAGGTACRPVRHLIMRLPEATLAGLQEQLLTATRGELAFRVLP